MSDDGDKPISLRDYWGVLQSTDWYYEMAERQAYYDGRRSYQNAVQLASTSDAHKQLFDDYKAAMWNKDKALPPCPSN